MNRDLGVWASGDSALVLIDYQRPVSPWNTSSRRSTRLLPSAERDVRPWHH
jgi:hypothetical protein